MKVAVAFKALQIFMIWSFSLSTDCFYSFTSVSLTITYSLMHPFQIPMNIIDIDIDRAANLPSLANRRKINSSDSLFWIKVLPDQKQAYDAFSEHLSTSDGHPKFLVYSDRR